MDIDRLQRKDIDDAANDRITLAIDAISTMESPYILDDVDGYKGSNWLLAGEKYVKYNIAEEDSLVFLYGPVRDLSEKNIICITVSFDYLLDEYVAPIVLDNISLIHDSVDFTITGLELNGEGHMDVNCSLFGIDNHVLNGIISGEGFGIGLNFKGNNSNASVSIGNVKLVFEYDDDLQDEINAVANRFIAGLSASRNDDVSDDVNNYNAIMDLFTGSDDSGVVDTALDSSSSNPVANSVITNEFNTKRNIQRTLVYNADSTLEEGHYYYTGGIVNPGQNQGVSFLDVSVNPQYDNMITQVCYEYDYGESFDNDVHQYIRYSTDGGTNWSSWKRFAEESEINSLSGSITNKIYPIGSIYMSVNSTNPSELFGGTWERIQDRFILASGSTYSNGSTGGSATVTLTKDEMPSHTHVQNAHSHTPSSVGANWVPNTQSVTRSQFSATSSGNKYSLSTGSRDDWKWAGTSSTTATNQNTGGGQAHNNMPPYLAVYGWKRTA